MNEELKRLLCEFEMSQVVEAACRETFGQSRHFAVPAMVKGAVRDGLLQVMDTDGPIVDSPAVYCRFLMLTDAGRNACGLQRAEKPKTERTLF